MGKGKSLLKLIRVRQWFKNMVLLLGAFFGGLMFEFSVYPLLILGFFLSCAASSFNYIVNDLIDLDQDRLHPEKARSRPLASGEVSKPVAVILAVGFLVIALVPAWFLSFQFFLMIGLIIATGNLYNAVLKHHTFVDVISLAMIYIWRVAAGCFLVGLFVSPWLWVGVFLAALFLVLCKRRADLDLLGDEEAKNHKRVYEQYNKDLLDQAVTLIANALFIVYCIYAILGPFEEEQGQLVLQNDAVMILSIPFALYLILRYLSLLSNDPRIARSPYKAIKDRGLLIGGLCFLGIVLVAFYLDPQYLAIFGALQL